MFGCQLTFLLLWCIGDVERGAELSFSDPRVRFVDPSASSSNFVFKRPNFGFRQTDGQTDAISIFWAVKNEKFGIYLGFSLPCGTDKYWKFYSRYRLWLFEQDPLCICSTVGFNSFLEAPLFVIFIILESTSSPVSRKFATGTHRLVYRKDNEYQKLTPCLLANVGRSRRKRGF